MFCIWFWSTTSHSLHICSIKWMDEGGRPVQRPRKSSYSRSRNHLEFKNQSSTKPPESRWWQLLVSKKSRPLKPSMEWEKEEQEGVRDLGGVVGAQAGLGGCPESKKNSKFLFFANSNFPGQRISSCPKGWTTMAVFSNSFLNN